jgi:hypothetical protein
LPAAGKRPTPMASGFFAIFSALPPSPWEVFTRVKLTRGARHARRRPMPPRKHYTAFVGTRMLASGAPHEVALAIKRRAARGAVRQPLVFDNATGRQIDLDLGGSDDEIMDRYEDRATPAMAPRGRPRLGVVAREVTLLPRHWEWLDSQPGGASVALRRLVDQARHATPIASPTGCARHARRPIPHGRRRKPGGIRGGAAGAVRRGPPPLRHPDPRLAARRQLLRHDPVAGCLRGARLKAR